MIQATKKIESLKKKFFFRFLYRPNELEYIKVPFNFIDYIEGEM